MISRFDHFVNRFSKNILIFLFNFLPSVPRIFTYIECKQTKIKFNKEDGFEKEFIYKDNGSDIRGGARVGHYGLRGRYARENDFGLCVGDKYLGKHRFVFANVRDYKSDDSYAGDRMQTRIRRMDGHKRIYVRRARLKNTLLSKMRRGQDDGNTSARST